MVRARTLHCVAHGNRLNLVGPQKLLIEKHFVSKRIAQPVIYNLRLRGHSATKAQKQECE
jgi:hypothetical protein